jgi:hypothetical protein
MQSERFKRGCPLAQMASSGQFLRAVASHLLLEDGPHNGRLVFVDYGHFPRVFRGPAMNQPALRAGRVIIRTLSCGRGRRCSPTRGPRHEQRGAFTSRDARRPGPERHTAQQQRT